MTGYSITDLPFGYVPLQINNENVIYGGGYTYYQGVTSYYSEILSNAGVTGVSYNGTVVGFYYPNGGNPVGFTDLNGNITTISLAAVTYIAGVSDAGVIYGSYSNGSELGFIDDNGLVSTINLDPSGYTAIQGVDGDGDFYGVTGDSVSGQNWFYNVGGKYYFLGSVIPNFQYLTGVANNGEAVGNYIGSDGHSHGVVISDGSISTFDIPGALDTHISAINDSGVIAGYYTTSGGAEYSGFVDDIGQISTINLPGDRIIEITGINNAGTVVGYAAGGADFVANPACFLRGVRIKTSHGEIAVENLRAGDLVLTASGSVKPIKWLGRRALDGFRHSNPTAVWPIRVSAGAFASDMPSRGLWLSPGHNIAVDGVLMPIGALQNGRSVVQIKRRKVEYWHIELEDHDILLAEGLPAESYLDTGNRTAFENGGAFIEAHPNFQPKHWADTCLPLVTEGPAVVAVMARLLARLAEAGHVVDQEADPHLMVDGTRIEPSRRSETRLEFELPAGGREIVLHSKTFVPAHTVSESFDIRALGLCVGVLHVDGVALALHDDANCPHGWHEAELVNGRFTHRWTTGATPLPGSARKLAIDLAGGGYYWCDLPTSKAQRGITSGRRPICRRSNRR